MESQPHPTLDDVWAAAARIAPFAHRTPVMTSRSLDELTGARLFFKCENLQRVGAFKFRGAMNATLQLPSGTAVATHSSGNHAAAIALAARLTGRAAHVVMPTSAAAVKRAAVLAYGARVVDCAPTLAARESTLAEVVAATGAAFVHPYNDPRVIAGAGTAALELVTEVPDLDLVIAPVGGGGLLGGTAIAARGLRPALRVIGAEPALADDARRSLERGTIVPSVDPRTVCDGLLTSLGPLTFAILRAHVERIATASEAAIVAAMRLVWQRMKLVIEPSSAVPLALLTEGALDARGRRVGIILSGGNFEPPLG
jgi:threonine dehydratase